MISKRSWFTCGLTLRLGLFVLLLEGSLATPIQAHDIEFSPKAEYPTLNGPVSVAVGDYNGDGRPDLAVADFYSDRVSILLGHGDGTFHAKNDLLVGTRPLGVTAGDLDGDGKLDLGVANYGSTSVSVLYGKGDGTFESQVQISTGSGAYHAIIVDIDNNGKNDLLVANGAAGRISVIEFDPDRTFSLRSFEHHGYAAWIAAGDLDGDGKLDLAIANYFEHSVSVRVQDPDQPGSFPNRLDIPSGTRAYSVTLGDFNGDGKLDLAVANQGSFNVSILLNDPTDPQNSFPTKTDYPVGPYPAMVITGDFNRDGKLDLAAANEYSGGSVSLLEGQGNGTFESLPALITGVSAYRGAVGDLDRDGQADLVVPNGGVAAGGSTVAVFLNISKGGLNQATLDTRYAQVDAPSVTFSGAVAAQSFTGDGTGLSNVAASTANTSTASGVASLAETANNALALGGVPASGYAQLNATNAGNLAASGKGTFRTLSIGNAAGLFGVDATGKLTTATTIESANNTDTVAGSFINNHNLGSNDALYALHTGFGNALHAKNTQENGRAALFESTKPFGTNEGLRVAMTSPAGTAGIFHSLGDGRILSLQNSSGEVASVDGSGIFHFASGQTFPGTGLGTITGVTAGSGLTGGGTSGNISFAVDSTVARTSSANSFTGDQTVTGNVTATAFSGSGAALTDLSAGSLASGTVADGRLSSNVALRLADNVFSSQQRVELTSTTLPGPPVGVWSRVFGYGPSSPPSLTGVFGSAPSTGVYGFGGSEGVYGRGNTGVLGSGTSYGVIGNGSSSNGAGVYGVGSYGVSGSSGSATGAAGYFINNGGGNILIGQSGFNVTKFSVDGSGNIISSGSLTLSGSLTVGDDGTAITKHLSILVNPTFAIATPIKPVECSTETFTLTGAADGDTIAMGVPNARMNLDVPLVYAAWVSAPDRVVIRACNFNDKPHRIAGTGAIRIDLWKH